MGFSLFTSTDHAVNHDLDSGPAPAYDSSLGIDSGLAFATLSSLGVRILAVCGQNDGQRFDVQTCLMQHERCKCAQSTTTTVAFFFLYFSSCEGKEAKTHYGPSVYPAIQESREDFSMNWALGLGRWEAREAHRLMTTEGQDFEGF
ncbi:hypothetical protein EVAR_24356_1 [Eumeta japonica]|uniref:Uncharacterized protein n=1 Tax=Eumeta variegata TaxID=151549 RepID=A0A4C1YDL9_EUMVA|nr:hypothetical protein EVAR_24356_1 [Eumeta japonica]